MGKRKAAEVAARRAGGVKAEESSPDQEPARLASPEDIARRKPPDKSEGRDGKEQFQFVAKDRQSGDSKRQDEVVDRRVVKDNEKPRDISKKDDRSRGTDAIPRRVVKESAQSRDATRHGDRGRTTRTSKDAPTGRNTRSRSF